MEERASWFLKIRNESVVGIGEAGPLPGLSNDDVEDYEEVLSRIVDRFNNAALDEKDIERSLKGVSIVLNQLIPEALKYSSIAFAFEQALLDLLHGGQRLIFDNSFVRGQPIPINGLIWMGGMDYMLQQIEIKIRDGFKCIKLKVGGMNFEKECDILQYVRRKYFRDQITVRLDANGSFKEEDAFYKLLELARFDVHSIEQPVKKGSALLPKLCADSPIPIALDEELIGARSTAEKTKILDGAKPQFIVLKPSLHGGLASCEEWIRLAEERSIGWWLTSALESSIGLNAIAQFTANYPIKLPQGLGTGKIYDDNIESPLTVSEGQLAYRQSQPNWGEN